MLANCIVWPQRLVWGNRRCSSSLAPRLNMRLFALLQIALLLTTSILPEGRMLLSQAQVCSDGECGCLAESRRNGTCCCSTKSRDERDSESRCRQSGDEATSEDSTSVCCSRKVKSRPSEDCHEACCSTKPSPATRYDKAADVLETAVSGCSCGGNSPVVWVCHMPRTLPTRVPSPAFTWTHEVNVPVDDRRQRKVDEPPAPPPDNACC